MRRSTKVFLAAWAVLCRTLQAQDIDFVNYHLEDGSQTKFIMLLCQVA
jgi:hypothetical protein